MKPDTDFAQDDFRAAERKDEAWAITRAMLGSDRAALTFAERRRIKSLKSFTRSVRSWPPIRLMENLTLAPCTGIRR